MNALRYIVLFWLVYLQLNKLFAQDEKEVDYAISAQALHSWLFVHTKNIKDFTGTTGKGFQIDLNRYRKDQKAYDYAHCHYNSGYSFQYMHFSNPGLGDAFNLAYFIEPFLVDKEKFNLRLRAAGGINIATNPYNKIENPKNVAYSSHINGYLGLGFSAYYLINKSSSIFLNATYSHFSNGNLKNPNYGVNFPNIGFGYEHKISTKKKPVGELLFYSEHWRFDVAAFACNKSLPITPTTRYWAYGAYTQAGYRSGNINAWTLGMEAYVDQSMRVAMDSSALYGSLNLSNKLLGLLLGHEFLFNRCIFSQQLGVYLFKEVPGELINRVYHRWGFNYKLNRNFMAGVNLNANLQKAFIFDCRLVYCWYK